MNEAARFNGTSGCISELKNALEKIKTSSFKWLELNQRFQESDDGNNPGYI